MSNAWQVRSAVEADAAALSLVGAATFLETFAGIVSGEEIVTHCARAYAVEATQTLLTGGAQVWIAEAEGGAPVGFAMLTAPNLPGSRDGDVELKRIYSLSRYHGSGLGTALMEAAVSAASGRFDRLLLGVYAHNQRALAFYRKHGFAPIGERQFDVGGTLYDDIVFARPLTSGIE